MLQISGLMTVTVFMTTAVLRTTKREVWAGFVIAGGFRAPLYVTIEDAIQLYHSIQWSSIDKGVGASSTRGVIFSCLTTENHLKVRLECNMD